jgi:PadR family transcriptional regulator, regulatory protein PadR
MPPGLLGGFEHQVLLIVLRLGQDAYAPEIARELELHGGRRVSRGALYTTLDRLETRGLVRWKMAVGTPERDGLPRRRYSVTASGVTALRGSRRLLHRLWAGLEEHLEDPT